MSTEQNLADQTGRQLSTQAELLQLMVKEHDGDALVSLFQIWGSVPVRGCHVPFNASRWDLDAGMHPVSNTHLYHPRFDEDEDSAVWKLYLVKLLAFGSCKINTAVQRLNRVRRSFARCGCGDARWSRVSLGGYEAHVESMAGISARTRRQNINALKDFLEFRQGWFGVPLDDSLATLMDADTRVRIARSLEVATPRIDAPYLGALLSACQDVLDDEGERHDDRIVAACILLASQIGMRVSELLLMEAGAVRIEEYEGGKGIPYLRFKVTKGAGGDGRSRDTTTFMNHLAMRGYRWLEDGCRARRDALGTDALVVFPRQTNQTPVYSTLIEHYKAFLLRHRARIPCIDTQESFPDLSRVPIAKLSTRKGVGKTDVQGLTGNETLVYPKFHSFRVTVATELYESGKDLRWIKRQMNHLAEVVTALYIKGGEEVDKAYSEAVHRALIGDGAELIGKHGEEFTRAVRDFADDYKASSKVLPTLEEVAKAATRVFGLSRKAGGVCIRCSSVIAPCDDQDETDKIFCAFGLCPYQHALYYHAAHCLGTVRSCMDLVRINLERNRAQEARHELRKAQNVIRDWLVPELDSLEGQLETHGREHVLEQHPELEELIDSLEEVRREIDEWQSMKI